MAEQTKSIALAILGIVAVIAIIGLILMFAKMKETGAVAGVYGRGGLGVMEGSAINTVTNDRVLFAGELPAYNEPQGTETIKTEQGSWKTGPRTSSPTIKTAYKVEDLNLEGNVPIRSCFDFTQFAKVNPKYAKYVDYATQSSIQQAMSVYEGKCVSIKVNGREPFPGLCCYKQANRLY